MSNQLHYLSLMSKSDSQYIWNYLVTAVLFFILHWYEMYSSNSSYWIINIKKNLKEISTYADECVQLRHAMIMQ